MEIISFLANNVTLSVSEASKLKKMLAWEEPFKISKIQKFGLAKFANFLYFSITCGNCCHF